MEESSQHEILTDSEIEGLVEESAVHGGMESGEAEYIQNVFRFGDLAVSDVMVHRTAMVMINAATGFRRVDRGKLALARSYGASTLQIFWKIRAPMALPMILVGLMIGAIFGLLTAVGAEMVGGGFGLGNRLTSYSSMIQMPQFFAVVLILSILGILIYVLFFFIGKKWASWEA